MNEQHYLTSLFEPKSVAIIGASDRENSVGNVLFKNILESGYKGLLYPINPKHETIQGVRAYKSIEEIGAARRTGRPSPRARRPFLTSSSSAAAAASRTSSSSLPGSAKPAIRARRSNARHWRSHAATASAYSAPTVWASSARELKLNATFARVSAEVGNLALISQSGAMCSAVLDWAKSNRGRLLQRHLAGQHGRHRLRRNPRLPRLRQSHTLHPALHRRHPERAPFHECAAFGRAHQADHSAQGRAPRGRLGGGQAAFGNGRRVGQRVRRRRASRRCRARQERRAIVLRLESAGLQVLSARQATGHRHQRRWTGRHGGGPCRRHGHSTRRVIGGNDQDAQRVNAADLVAEQSDRHRRRTRRPSATATPSSPWRRTTVSTASWSCSRRRR